MKYLQSINLKNKFALVTGAGKGLGRACSIALAEAGATVIALSRTQKDLDQLEKEIKKIKGKVIKIHCDVMNYSDLQSKLQKVKIIDILVNNAGITKDNLAIRMNLEEWNKVINVNLTSSFLLSQQAIKFMIKNKNGSIINISSVVGHTGNAGQVNYSSSKAGLIAMSKTLAREYAKKNIRVNCISPGFIETEMTSVLKDEYKQMLLDQIPMGRMGHSEDIANTVSFLASDFSSYITGETIHINGGMYMS